MAYSITPSILLLFILASILPAISPGPGVLLALSNSLRYGPRAVVISGAGNALGLFFLGIGVFAGLGVLLETSAFTFTIIKLVGAAYMIYLGVKTWRDRSGFDSPKCSAPSPKRLYFSAFMLSITNPKAVVLQAALFPLFMTSNMTHLDALVFSLAYALMCWLNHCFIGIMAEPLKRAFSTSRRLAAFRKTIGAGFIGFGAALTFTSH